MIGTTFAGSYVRLVNRPRRHHVVPRFYLNRWGGESERLAVRRRTGHSFVAGTHNVAVESGFYDIVEPSGTVSTAVEVWLGRVEHAAADVLAAIETTGEPPRTGTQARRALAEFLALQFTRTPEQRERTLFPERVRTWLDGRDLTRDLMHEYLRDVHLRFEPAADEIEGAFSFVAVALNDPDGMTDTDAVDLMVRSAQNVAPAIEGLHWSIEHDRRGRFISSDTPLTLWRPPSPRDSFEGIGVVTATEIRFPLDPWIQLVLAPDERPLAIDVATDRPRHCNADVAYGCHHMVFGSVEQAALIGRLPLASHRPVLRFAQGPGFTERADGTLEPIGDIIHNWVPRR